jgi:hypothetical protein
MTSELSPSAARLKQAFEIFIEEVADDGSIGSLRQILTRIAADMPTLEPDEVVALFKRAIALQNALQDPLVEMKLGLVEGEPVPDAAFAAGAELPVSIVEDAEEATTVFDISDFRRAIEAHTGH